MAQIDDAFFDFLKAYGHTSALNALDTDAVSESRVNAIFSRHKDTFDAWLKCPGWLKDKYRNKIPYDILAKAAADPNFTEADALKADAEHNKSKSSLVPSELEAHPMYKDMCSYGVRFTVAQIAAMKLMAESYKRNGYSHQGAEKIAATSALIGIGWDNFKKIGADPSLSAQQKQEQQDHLYQKINEARVYKHEVQLRDLEETQPERAFIRLFIKGDEKSPDMLANSDNLIQQIIEMKRMDLLAEQIRGKTFEMRVRGKARQAFFDVLSAHGINPADLNRQQATNAEHLAENTSYVQQTFIRQTYLSS